MAAKLPQGVSRGTGSNSNIFTGPFERDGFKGTFRLDSTTGETQVFGKDNKQVFKIEKNEIIEFDVNAYKSSVDQSVLNKADSSGNLKPITEAQVKTNIQNLSLGVNNTVAGTVKFLKETDTNYQPPAGIPGGDNSNVTVSNFKGGSPVQTGVGGIFSGTIYELLDNIFGGKFEINVDFTSANMETLYPANRVFQYPLNALYGYKGPEFNSQVSGGEGQDYLQITQYEYKAPYSEVFTVKGINEKLFKNGEFSGVPRGSALKKAFSTVLLPIPNDVMDSNQVAWSDDGGLTTAAAAAANLTLNDMPKAAVISVAPELANIPGLDKIPYLGDLANVVKNSPELKKSIRNILMTGTSSNGYIPPDTQASLASLLLQQAGFEVSPETILSRGHGVVVNSNMELLFSRPAMRSFTFRYRMTPRSEREATEIKNIIRYFKQGMAAKKANAKAGRGGPSYFLSTPNVFKLAYKSGNEEISGMNKFKICALVGCSVNYTPDQTWAAYEKGQPASYSIGLSFSEIEPIYESDYQEKVSSSFKTSVDATKTNLIDNPSVAKDDIGF